MSAEEERVRARHGLAQAGISWARAEVGSAKGIFCDRAFFDMVLSHGVLNLSPDKERAFREIFRVLRPGGRLYFADIVQSGRVPREAAGDPDSWSQRITGAIPPLSDYEPEIASSSSDLSKKTWLA